MFLGLCLAQSGKPFEDLGYRSWGDAYQKIGVLLGVPSSNVKFTRDHFYRHTDSARKGWDKPLSLEMQKYFEAVQDLDRGGIIQLGREILARDWSDLRSGSMNERLEGKLISHFSIDGFTPLVETMDTTWGIRNKPGRTFRLSNSDLVIAFEEILQNWNEWTKRRLNKNDVNPDATLTDFAAQFFSEGAHQVLANDQRRGFLHLVSAITYLCSNNGKFDKVASSKPFSKQDYERALETLKSIEEEAVTGFSRVLTQEARSEVLDDTIEAKPASAGVNKIYYGAPGTGKSHAVNDIVGMVNVVRTVFHPDTQNSDFFGCLKPKMEGDKVTYQFAPGPFCNALKAAFLDPVHHHYLVIEELNRAPAAAVFGELFQLLDRNQNGDGEYKVDFPNPESQAWFKAQGVQEAKLRMPSNLSIVATMNSADQGVYPLDTAFRRRWEQEYLPLYDGLGPQGVVNCFGKAGTVLRVSWRDFAMALNHCLLRFDIPEDRLLGLWFVKEHELNAQVPAKILLYLWDDLLRHGGRGHVFASGIKTFGQLDAAAKAEKAIFADAFLADLEALPQVWQHTDAQVAEAQIDAGVEEDEPDAKAQ